MIYTQMTNKAIKLMFEKHKNQVDKSGLPYVFHPWHVAESMQDEKRTTVALLHDIVEDTNVTYDDLKNEGYPNDVIDAVRVLTHDANEDYSSYIERIAQNDLAIDVKIADLMHNIDASRLSNISSADFKKYDLYRKSLDYLKSIKNLNQNNMHK